MRILLAPRALGDNPSLALRIPEAVCQVVVPGSCAHLIWSGTGVFIGAVLRFGTAILGESVLAGLANTSDALVRLLSDLLEQQPAIHCLFLLAATQRGEQFVSSQGG